MKTTYTKGFTLMEILLVLGLMGIVFSFTAFISFDTYHGSNFRNERGNIQGALLRARSRSINNVCSGPCLKGQAHGVHFSPTQYTLFQGDSYATRNTAYDESYTTNSGFTLSDLTDVMFYQLSGDATTTPAGVWDLVMHDSTNHISTTSINQYGQITWTN